MRSPLARALLLVRTFIATFVEKRPIPTKVIDKGFDEGVVYTTFATAFS